MDRAPEPQLPQRAWSDAPSMRELHAAWTPKDVLFGCLWFVALFVAGQVAIVPLAVIYGDKSGQLYTSAFIIGAAVEIGIALVAANYTFRRYGGGWRQLGIAPIKRSTLFWAGAAFVGALVASLTYGAIVEVFDLDFLRSDCAEQIPKGVRDQRALLALASVTVIAFAPVCEELFFRGFVFRGLASRWGLVAGIVASGLLFAGAHLLYKSFVPIAGVGMVFAYAYYLSRNIVSTMLAHVAFNSLSIAFIAGGSCDSASIAHVLAHAWLPL